MKHTRTIGWALASGLCLGVGAPADAAQREAIPREAAVDGGWLRAVEDGLRRAQHAFAATDGGLAAVNVEQGLRASVTARGITVEPLGGPVGDGGWSLALRTIGVGRTGDARALAEGELAADAGGARLAFGDVEEWLVNDERGLEQGWDLASRPAGDPTLPVAIELAVAGTLSLAIDDDARGGRFVDAHGRPRLDYRGLVAFDADGADLDARMVPTPSGFAIEVDDRGARYPITVDPLLTGAAWSFQPDTATARLGQSVAAAGDVNGDGFADLVAGAPFHDEGAATDAGRAYVFYGSAGGLSTTPDWIATGDQAGGSFGASVAGAGDVNGDGFSDVAIAAPDRAATFPGEGRVHVYLGSAAGLSATPDLVLDGGQFNAAFGGGLAGAGDVDGDGYADLLVGAPFFDGGQLDEGRAALYLGSAAGLAATPAWTFETDQGGSRNGFAVAGAGDLDGDGFDDVLVGAPLFDDGQIDEGAMFVFMGSASGPSSTPDQVFQIDQATDQYGFALGTAGDTNGDGLADVIVGAPFRNTSGTQNGEFFVYLGSALGLETAPVLTGTTGFANGHLGYAVGTAGDTNADGYSEIFYTLPDYTNGQAIEGAFGVKKGSPSGPQPFEDAYFIEYNVANRSLGRAGAGIGDVDGDGRSDLVMGVPLFGSTQVEEGLVIVYEGRSLGLRDVASWAAEGSAANEFFGSSIGVAGDVDGDGYSDVLVGAERWFDGADEVGRAYLFRGGPDGLETTASWFVQGVEPGARFGRRVRGAGDVNGDGYDDVLVTAPFHDDGVSTSEGRAFLYLGSPSGPSTTPDWEATADQAQSLFGEWASRAGDVNGDGYGDVLVGAPDFDSSFTNEGAAFLYLGGPTGLSRTFAWATLGGQTSARYGLRVVSAGDVDADGYDDVLISAPDFLTTATNRGGKAFLFRGNAFGLEFTPWFTDTVDSQNDADFGADLAGIGDVNGDGYADWAIAAFRYDNGQTDEGKVWVYHGGTTAPATHAWTQESGQIGAFYGQALSPAGDVDGDGTCDLVVGAYPWDAGQTSEGRLWVYLGSSSGLSLAPDWSVEPNVAGHLFGYATAGGGDFNGDGYGDVLVGGYGFATSRGKVYAFLGGDGAGWVHRVQQLRADGSAPIALSGTTDASNTFRIRCAFESALAGFTSAQSTEAFIEWQVAPVGSPYGVSQRSPVGQVVDGSTLVFDEQVGGLLGGTTWKWRARVVTTNPLFPATPWVSATGNGMHEGKLSTPSFPANPGIPTGPSSNLRMRSVTLP